MILLRPITILLISAILLIPAGNVTAQVPTSPAQPSSATPRPSDGESSVFALLRSGGDLLVGLFRDDDAVPTVDDPRWNSLESPRQTVLTFLEAMRHVDFGRDEAWPRSEKTIQLPPESDLSRREVARDLKSVFDRLLEISPNMLPSEEEVRRDGMRRFELFPYGVEHLWIWDRLKNAPEGEIVLVETRDGKWLFAAETVRGAHELAASLRPIAPRAREQRRGELFLRTFGPLFTKTPWWGWLSLLGGVLAGIGAAWLVVRLLDRIGARFERHDARTVAQAWRAIGKPFTLVLIAVGILIGSAPMHLGVTLDQIRWHTIELLLLVALGWLAVEIVDLLIVASQQVLFDDNDQYVKMGTMVLPRVLKAAVALVLTIFVLQNILPVDLTVLLGGLGLITLAITLAAQDAVKNLFGAFMVFMNRPFLVGDWVEFHDQIGEVEDVGMQVTRIRLLSGELWTLPNMHFIEDPVENISLRTDLRRKMDIHIPYDTPATKIARAGKLLEELLTSDEVVAEGKCRLDEFAPLVSFSDFGDYYLNIRVYYWYFMSDSGNEVQRNTQRGWFTYLDHCNLVNRQIVERFNAERIEFAFPTRTLYVANDPVRKFEVATEQGDSSGHAANHDAGRASAQKA